MGSWLAEMIAFLNDRHDFGIRVTLLSRQAYAFRERAPHLASRSDVRLVESDVRNLASLAPDTQWIIHGAANPDRRTHFSNPVETMETIILGTRALLSAASRLTPLERILCLGSGLIYGPQNWKDTALGEKAFSGLSCNSPSNLYAESKRAAEMVTAAYRSQYGVPVLNARLFAFIGPYQALDRPWAINNFLSDAMRGGPIRVQGDGATIRSYLYGSDLADWLLRLLVNGQPGGAYNVGSPVGISLRDLAIKIAENCLSRPGIELNTLPTANLTATRWLPDASRAEADCRLQVRTSLDEAIRRTVAWHSSRLREPATV